MKDAMRSMVSDIPAYLHEIRPGSLQACITRYPAHAALMGIQIMWTHDSELSLIRLRAEKGIMALTFKKFKALLDRLVAMNRSDPPALHRTVETADAIRLSYPTNLCVKRRQLVLFAGTVGAGKTNVIKDELGRLDSDEVIFRFIDFTSRTVPKTLQAIVESALDNAPNASRRQQRARCPSRPRATPPRRALPPLSSCPPPLSNPAPPASSPPLALPP